MTTSIKRLASLDFLRCLAVAIVLVGHTFHLGPAPDSVPQWAVSLLVSLSHIGWMGVDLFFVLSGFLVSGLLFSQYQKTGRISIGRFYLRRGFKIYPAFYFLIGMTVLLYALGRSHLEPVESRLWPELLFLQSYFPSLWGHTWSLAVEEHFYFLLPLALLAFCRRHPGASDPFRALPKAVFYLAVACLSTRLVSYRLLDPDDLYLHFTPTHLRLDSLAFGTLLSYVAHFRPGIQKAFPQKRLLLIAALTLIPVLCFPQGEFAYTVGFTLLYLGFGTLLYASLNSSLFQRRWTTGFSRIGAYSYSIYLWHMPVLVWILPRTYKLLGKAPEDMPYLLKIALYLFLSVAIGIILGRAIELPFLRLRDHLFPSDSPSNKAKWLPPEI